MEYQTESQMNHHHIVSPVPLDAHPDEIDSPDLSGYLTVLTAPHDSVSITFAIAPKDEATAIGSITTGFFRSQGGVTQANIGGTSFSVTPAVAGQKITGGTSEKISAFPSLPSGEVYEAILQGTLKKEGVTAGSFFLTRVVQISKTDY